MKTPKIWAGRDFQILKKNGPAFGFKGGGKFVVVVFSFFKQKPLLCCDFCFSQMKYMSSAFALEEECLSLQQV